MQRNEILKERCNEKELHETLNLVGDTHRTLLLINLPSSNAALISYLLSNDTALVNYNLSEQ
jgi:hypothetical protein